MAQTTYGYEHRDRSRLMKDVDVWMGNGLALVFVGLAIACGVIGMLMGFGYINEDSSEPFQDAMLWLIPGLILAICGNVFRREHHVVDAPDTTRTTRT